MDPLQALKDALEALFDRRDLDGGFECLQNYTRWRMVGGAEPQVTLDGDRVAELLNYFIERHRG